MRVTRHPYEVEGWGVGELWIGDGRVVVAHDPPTPGVRLHGALAQSSPGVTPQTAPRGTPGVPTETLSTIPSRVCDVSVPTSRQLASIRCSSVSAPCLSR